MVETSGAARLFQPRARRRSPAAALCERGGRAGRRAAARLSPVRRGPLPRAIASRPRAQGGHDLVRRWGARARPAVTPARVRARPRRTPAPPWPAARLRPALVRGRRRAGRGGHPGRRARRRDLLGRARGRRARRPRTDPRARAAALRARRLARGGAGPAAARGGGARAGRDVRPPRPAARRRRRRRDGGGRPRGRHDAAAGHRGVAAAGGRAVPARTRGAVAAAARRRRRRTSGRGDPGLLALPAPAHRTAGVDAPPGRLGAGARGVHPPFPLTRAAGRPLLHPPRLPPGQRAVDRRGGEAGSSTGRARAAARRTRTSATAA